MPALKNRLLVFDLDDTLVSWSERVHPTRAQVAAYLASRLSGSHAEWLELLSQRDGDLWQAVTAGSLEHEDLPLVRMTRILAQRGVRNPEIATEAVRLQHRSMLEHARMDAAVHDLLESLAGANRLYLLTNGLASLQWPTLKRLGLERHFEEILICSELRRYKPDLFPFEEALRRAACPPEDAVMIGDSWSDDIVPALKLGMKAIWYNPAGLPSANGVRPDHVIADLASLPALLRGKE